MPVIPGSIKCALYDEGGEGVAYHDRDAIDQAAVCCGGMFRTNEGVDLGLINENHKSLNGPLDVGHYYIGWVFAGEWVKYTVRVKQTGTYQINARMTSASTKCQLRFLVNDQDATGPITVTRSTGDVHVWDWYPDLARVKLHAGVQVLTLEFFKGQHGDQNFDRFGFCSGWPMICRNDYKRIFKIVPAGFGQPFQCPLKKFVAAKTRRPSGHWASNSTHWSPGCLGVKLKVWP